VVGYQFRSAYLVVTKFRMCVDVTSPRNQHGFGLFGLLGDLAAGGFGRRYGLGV
jgi:hypothetical protein